jgi:hypothetical protein
VPPVEQPYSTQPSERRLFRAEYVRDSNEHVELVEYTAIKSNAPARGIVSSDPKTATFNCELSSFADEKVA